MSNEHSEDIGYLKRAIEDLAELVKSHMDREEEEREEDRSLAKANVARLKKIEDELNMYKTAYRGIKWLIALALLIITLKFGDIPKMFGG